MEDSKSRGTASAEQHAKALKVAASLSFSGPAVQAAASASYANSAASKNDHKDSSLDVNMTWKAKGGDTLLCNK